ncbi:MAG: hypothetical protein RQ885_08300 [Desulfurococcales archaeon]|jgi:hydrogenase expression/formation protein HypD|nr:hypothetical protein [Desulfurococcales archaeon]
MRNEDSRKDFRQILKMYRNPSIAMALRRKIQDLAEKIGEDILIVHVCGSHEWTMTHYGIRELLPENVDLRAGPGCPVCITPASDIDAAVKLALDGVTVATYGDMARAKGSSISLEEAKALGADVRIVFGVQDAIEMAKKKLGKEFLFFAVGMDTTAPATAYEILKGPPKNLSFLPTYRYTPAIQGNIMESNLLGEDAFIGAGYI